MDQPHTILGYPVIIDETMKTPEIRFAAISALADRLRVLPGARTATWVLDIATARSIGRNADITAKRLAGGARYRRRYERIGRAKAS